MTSTPSDDIDAMFDLPPMPEAAQPVADDTAAEEAALAAELAAIIESGGVAGDAPDSRGNLRVDVAWLARMRSPGGRVTQLRVRNVSESGVGLVSDEPVPADALVELEMDVPSIDGHGAITPVKATIRTTYTVHHAAEIRCGATWQEPSAGMALVRLWIRQLRD